MYIYAKHFTYITPLNPNINIMWLLCPFTDEKNQSSMKLSYLPKAI